MSFYNKKLSNIDGLPIFGQLGNCPNLTPKPKLNPKAKLVRYRHHLLPYHILVELPDGSTRWIHIQDFKPYSLGTDPNATKLEQLHTTLQTRFDIQEYKSAAKLPAPDKTPLHTDNIPDKWAHTHAAHLKKYANIPSEISPNTSPPRREAEALLYPDFDAWIKAIDQGLYKLYVRLVAGCNAVAGPK